MSTNKPFKVIFLCTGNSCRSIFGEYILRRLGQGRFESCSAGAKPSGTVNPLTIKVLQDVHKIDCQDARSKSWDEFKEIQFDFIITVCDQARESCPVWPGHPVTAHWSSPDPATFRGTPEERYKFFKDVSMQIRRRIELFCSLRFEKFNHARLTELTRNIGS